MTSPFTLIKESWEVFSKKENLLILVQVYLPMGVLAVVSLILTNVPFLANFLETQPGDIVVSTLDLFYALIAVFVNISGIIAIAKIIDGEKIQIKKVYKAAISKYWNFLLLTALIYLASILGTILLIVPLILVITWFAFSKFIMVEKGTGVKMSLSQSRKLVAGKFWKILGRILIFGLFYICSEIVLMFVPYGLGNLVFSLCGALFVLPQFLLYREISSDSPKVLSGKVVSG